MISDVKADWTAGADTLTFDNSTYQLYFNDSGTFKTYTTANGAGTTGYGGVNYSTGIFTAGDDKAVPYDAWFKVDNGGSPVYVRMAFSRSADNTIDSTDIPIAFEDTSRSGYSVEYRYNNASPNETATPTVAEREAADPTVSAYNTVATDQEEHWGFTLGYASWGTDSNSDGQTDYVITDAVEAGYEDQAGSFWVRSAKSTVPSDSLDSNSTTTGIQLDGNLDTGIDVDGDGILESTDIYTDDGYSRGSATNDDWEQFIIEYAGASVTAATGEIWDIDTGGSNEVFTVTAYNGSADLGVSVSDTAGTYNSNPADALPESNSGSFDALPWAWAFSGLSSPITKIVFTRTGAAAQYPLAFNNFNPVSSVSILTPEPSSILAFVSLFGVVGLRRRKRSV